MDSILRPPRPFRPNISEEAHARIVQNVRDHPAVNVVEKAAQYGLAAMLKDPRLAPLVPIFSQALNIKPNSDLEPLIRQVQDIVDQIQEARNE